MTESVPEIENKLLEICRKRDELKKEINQLEIQYKVLSDKKEEVLNQLEEYEIVVCRYQTYTRVVKASDIEDALAVVKRKHESSYYGPEKTDSSMQVFKDGSIVFTEGESVFKEPWK